MVVFLSLFDYKPSLINVAIICCSLSNFIGIQKGATDILVLYNDVSKLKADGSRNS